MTALAEREFSDFQEKDCGGAGTHLSATCVCMQHTALMINKCVFLGEMALIYTYALFMTFY